MILSSNKLSIIASDLETTMISSIQIESQDDGKIAIPSRMLLDTLKSFSNNLLTFIVDMNKFTVEMSSETGNYKLAGQNGDDFPKTPSLSTSNKININSSVLLNAINKTLFASGNDELRPVMSGVYCELSNEHTVFVATDAHKLVKHIRYDIISETNTSFILPKKPLSILKNHLVSETDVFLEYNETNAMFTFENTTIICRLIDGKYPNYDAVIPKKIQIN